MKDKKESLYQKRGDEFYLMEEIIINNMITASAINQEGKLKWKNNHQF